MEKLAWLYIHVILFFAKALYCAGHQNQNDSVVITEEKQTAACRIQKLPQKGP